MHYYIFLFLKVALNTITLTLAQKSDGNDKKIYSRRVITYFNGRHIEHFLCSKNRKVIFQ